MKSAPSIPKANTRMYLSTFVILFMLLLFGGTLALSACSTSSAQALYESKCSTCHSLEVVENSNYTEGEWAPVVKDMQSRTTTISDDDATQITEYLENRYSEQDYR